MPSAAEFLSARGVSMQQALDFVLSNQNHPEVIYNIAVQAGITNSMLAEIISPVLPGVGADAVENFFKAHGLNGSALNGTSSGTPSQVGLELMPESMNQLLGLVTFNQSAGSLSTAALRSAVVSTTGQAAYDKTFNPSSYSGAADGTFTGAELGISGFQSFAATQENLESIYYGTLIKAFKAIDVQEIMELSNFVTANQSALTSGNAAVLQSYMDLMVGIFQDPASAPILNDAQLASAVVMGTASMVQLVGTGDTPALFDGMFMGFMG